MRKSAFFFLALVATGERQVLGRKITTTPAGSCERCIFRRCCCLRTGTILRPHFGASQQASIDARQSFLEEIKAASPKTKVITPKIF